MTLRLILTRHAKSAWGDPSMDDHDRPLNQRGEKSAEAIGGWLASNRYIPSFALVSSAKRTRQTWALIAKAFDPLPEVVHSEELYHAEPGILMERLRKTQAASVMMVAHNPGIAYFAQGLVKDLPGDARFERYPTGATAVIDFDAPDWAQVAWNSGRVVDLAFPRDLV
ncbi:MAG: histidine phosphatase family protein [Maritimibacter sp.]|nr:histidine phosphatase family protein [Maritimibacter sp.]